MAPRALSRLVSRIVAALIVVLSVTSGACFPETKSIAAGASYEAQQLACVDNNATREAIDRCRMAVKRAWAADDAGAGAPEASAFVRVVAFDNGLDAGGDAGDASAGVLVFKAWPAPRLERGPLPPSLAADGGAR